jgi:protease IV
MRKTIGTIVIVGFVFLFASCLMVVHGMMGKLQLDEPKIAKSSILFLELDGVIIDGKDFMDDLDKYAKESDIKGVLIQINSPGGVVGPSQELYADIKRVRTELKKPVVVSVSSLAASGAFYAAVAADKIVTNPGSLIGSIGVIMEFANLEKLYDFAKIKRYVIKTGAYKDSGAEYREMRDDEKLLFQEMANEVLNQFKTTVSQARKLPMETINKIADGRVFTGERAVAMGLADQIGTLNDATKLIGQLAGVGPEPEIFTPPSKKGDILRELFDSRSHATPFEKTVDGAIRGLLHAQLWGQPLFLMPGSVDLGGH